MDKLDRLGWADGIAFVAYGLRIGIRVSDRDALDRIVALLPPGWRRASTSAVDRLYSVIVGKAVPSPGVIQFSLIYAGVGLLSRTKSLDEALAALDSDLRLYVAERARRRLFVHAGVVGWQGKAIVIPGRSYSGKSSLVAALVKAGATYYSDEYAVLDVQGRVHPYLVPPSFRRGPADAPEKHSLEMLPCQTGVDALPIGVFVVTKYRQGAKWRPRRLSPGRAVLALLANTVAARSKPKTVLGWLSQQAATAPILHGDRGEAHETAELLLSRMERA